MKTNPHQTQSPSQSEIEKLLDQYHKHEYHLAENLARTLTQKYPENQFGWKILGVVFKQTGRLQESLSANQKSVTLSINDAQAHNNLANTLQELGRLGEAEASYYKAISIKPDYAEAHNNLGTNLQEQGKLEDAEASFNKAVEIKPNFAEAFYNLSTTLLFLNKLNEAIQALNNLIEITPNNYGLKACVRLAILNYLNDEPSSSKSLLLQSADILNNKSSSFKNDVAYWKYLSYLLEYKKNIHNINDHLRIKKLYVIGDSHSLTSHGVFMKNSQDEYVCKSLWIVGCKQWHLGNSLRNKYKHKFEKIARSIPDYSSILLSIGEIDCRLDDGILSHIKKYPNKNCTELIYSTINSYLNYIIKVLSPFFHKIIIQGVPCPNINIYNSKNNDISKLIDFIQEFNLILQKQTKYFGLDFLDLHTLTNRGDGFSNVKWHIDQYHLSPAGMQEAWRTCFISNSE